MRIFENGQEVTNGHVLNTPTINDPVINGGTISGTVIKKIYTTSTDPAVDAAVTTAIVDANDGVIITLTAAGNAQIIEDPTTIADQKEFIVANNDTSTPHSITVNSVVIEAGEAQKFFWDGSAWLTLEAISASQISFTPAGTVSSTDVQSAIEELDTDKTAKPNDTLTVGSSGCDYTDLSTAIAAATTGQTVLVYPGTYTDTMTFAANNVTVIGMGKPNTVIVTQADAPAVDFNTRTGIQIKSMSLRTTAATTAIATVTGSTGLINLKECHTTMTTTADIAAASQPSVGEVTGAGTLTLTSGKFSYAHSGDGGGTAQKGAFKVGAGSTIQLSKVYDSTITTSGTELVTATSIDLASTGVVEMHNCDITMTCSGSLAVGLAYLGGTGITHEFYRNRIEIDATGCTDAYGFFAADTVTTTRTFFNHIHVENATNNYSFSVGTNSTLISAFDDIVADNAAVVAGSLKQVNSCDDGDLCISGDLGVDGTLTIGSDIDCQGNYAVDLQNFPDLMSGGPGYRFDGTDDVITVGDSTNLEFSTQFTFIVGCKSGYDNFTNPRDLLGKYNNVSGQREYLLHIAANETLSILFGDPIDGSFEGQYSSTSSISDIDNNHIYGVSYNAGTVILYDNGKPISGSCVDGVIPSLLFNGTSVFEIGDSEYTGNYPWAGDINYVRLFNLALTEAEVKAFSNGAAIPYALLCASQTELMPNQVDRDFSGASAWANVDLNAYDETGDLTITASAADQYCTCPVASAPTTIGKKYRMTYDIANLVSTWTVESFDGTQTIGTISAEGTQSSLEWTATTTGGYRIVAVAADSSGDFDNFTLTQIGCVLDLNQSGAGHNQWTGILGGSMFGATVSGALPTNLPVNHMEKYIDLAVTGDTSFTVTAGYKITSIILFNTTANAVTGGINIGLSAGSEEVVANFAMGANALVDCTLLQTFFSTTVDDIVYINDVTSWNSASLEMRVKLERIV